MLLVHNYSVSCELLVKESALIEVCLCGIRCGCKWLTALTIL